MPAIEKLFPNGNGATEYMLSRCDGNDPCPKTMPDTEGCDLDGTLRDNFPASVGPSIPTP